MKLVRFGPPGRERPGLWLDHAPETSGPGILDVRAMAWDIADYDTFFFSRHGLKRLDSLLRETRRIVHSPQGLRLGPPVAPGGRIFCIGKNYPDHAREFGGAPPERPIVFGKAPAVLNGPFDPVVRPPLVTELDYEVELAVVIGATASNLPEAQADTIIAGYTLFNDLTDREAQRKDGQWFRGKSADSLCPVGPWLVTPDELPTPADIELSLTINGDLRQRDRVGSMAFSIPFLVSYLSRTITLNPGDLLATGTPSGVGFARTPPTFLNPGDVLHLTGTGLGAMEHRIIG
ncbi:MAG TPA: fumarylacetoacetate hydrolase family protein [Kiritimatiellia bacterium]|nr:fumarylacetoacetate hydrolase family protein [Kiritimatiellia bacterium]